MRPSSPARVAVLTGLAMLAFAANSLLCRLALADARIDAASFTGIRAASGAAVLVLVWLLRPGRPSGLAADWRSIAALFVYLVFFAFAYEHLGAATGALILFGSVQLTMFGWALRAGERLSARGALGLALAVAGLVYLVAPGLTAPSPLGALLMAVAGVAWGAYSLVGRRAADPLAATAANFVFATPAVLVVALLLLPSLHVSIAGAGLAVASGALASGCGYVIWYAALPGLGAARAATVQLSVPVIAALGAVLLLAEPATLRLVLASIATLGGVAIALRKGAGARPRPNP